MIGARNFWAWQGLQEEDEDEALVRRMEEDLDQGETAGTVGGPEHWTRRHREDRDDQGSRKGVRRNASATAQRASTFSDGALEGVGHRVHDDDDLYRSEVEVLSVIAQQIATLQAAVASPFKTFHFDGARKRGEKRVRGS